MGQLKIYLPPPSNWQDFQTLVKDIAAVRYDPATVQEYGRQGQVQFGVDTFAMERDGKTRIGIQCKETKDPLTEKEIRTEADKARSFPNGLHVYILATTYPTDARLQDVVIGVNNGSIYPFKLRIEFWNDLVNDINKFASVINSCYENYRTTFKQTDESQHLACLRMAFDRPAFKDDFLCELSYHDFERALSQTKRLFRTGLTVDSWTGTPTTEAIAVDLLPVGNYRSFVAKLEKKLEVVYQTYIRHKARANNHGRAHANYRYEQEDAAQLNMLRRDLLVFLNRRLEKARLDRISFMYE
jgi:hypothetical protein